MMSIEQVNGLKDAALEVLESSVGKWSMVESVEREAMNLADAWEVDDIDSIVDAIWDFVGSHPNWN